MTDAHCHVSCGDSSVREFLIGRDFVGVHPWDAESTDLNAALKRLESQLVANPHVGVGEIGLDRLRDRNISPKMRELFERQLALADAYRRPVTLHGAKCWGQVVEAVKRLGRNVPWFIYHGFSRSDGLVGEIVANRGFISVGPAVLNDHAVNYRELVRKIPPERLLVETDRTETASAADIRSVAAKVAELRGMPPEELIRSCDANLPHWKPVVAA